MGCILSCKKNAIEEAAQAPRPVSLSPTSHSPTPTPPAPDADEGHVPEAVQTYGWAGTLSGPPVGQGLQGSTCGGSQSTTTHRAPDCGGALSGWKSHPLSDVQEEVTPSPNVSGLRKKKYRFDSNDTSTMGEIVWWPRDKPNPFTDKAFKPRQL
ncbi:hypothetical protein PV11_04623 [Exophiala sideris]|uniref:Uncharacterized protein n=1 Tax=Exophiala sideris TaxID=1016849 RepID=A0A0D1W1C7_9EURO|nr:hypothetical protein PV11_04623 [Exophiala sideris]